MLDWSTTEQDTGAAYIDGKRIFVKAVVIPAGPNNNEVTYAHGIVGLSEMVDSEGWIDDGTLFRPLPYADNTAANSIEFFLDATNVRLRSGVAADFSGYAGNVNLFYTKT